MVTTAEQACVEEAHEDFCFPPKLAWRPRRRQVLPEPFGFKVLCRGRRRALLGRLGGRSEDAGRRAGVAPHAHGAGAGGRDPFGVVKWAGEWSRSGRREWFRSGGGQAAVSEGSRVGGSRK